MKWVVLGSIAIVVAMWLMLTFNPIAGRPNSAFENIVASLFVVIFGFLFVTVSSRICGLIGIVGQPGERHDDRDADGDLRDVPGHGVDRAGVLARSRSPSAAWCASPRQTPARRRRI